MYVAIPVVKFPGSSADDGCSSVCSSETGLSCPEEFTFEPSMSSIHHSIISNHSGSVFRISESQNVVDSAGDLYGSFSSVSNALSVQTVEAELTPYEGYLFDLDASDKRQQVLPSPSRSAPSPTIAVSVSAPVNVVSGPRIHAQQAAAMASCSASMQALPLPDAFASSCSISSSPNNIASKGSPPKPGRGENRRGQGYRKLWAQVTKVNRGQKLGDCGGVPFPDMTVEDLLKLVLALPAQESVVSAVAPGLYYLDSSALAALLKELSKQGHIKRAFEIFDWLKELPDSHELSSLCDVYTYTTMISQCGSHQQLRRALELVAEMRSKGVCCNVHTFSALMNVCIKANETDLALDVYKQMLQEGCQPNLVTYNTLIDVHLKTQNIEETLRILDQLESQGMLPEVRTYNTIISACNKAGQPEQALQVYERMLAAGVRPSATTFTALISAYGKKGNVEKAVELFDDMVNKGCERNVITYSSLISVCERAGRWELALELFNKMHHENCKPNIVTYNSLIAACTHGGHWEKASELFDQMLSQGCKPDCITYSALMMAYEKGGQWRRALKAYEQMQQQGCNPDAVVFNALMQVLWNSGVVIAQMRAVQLWAVASKCGHFRIYTQNKLDSDALQYSAVAFTTGAAVVVVIRWLAELRNKASKDNSLLMKPRVRFTIQKSKHLRVESPCSAILQAISVMLAGAKSPFAFQSSEQAVMLEVKTMDLAAWMQTQEFLNLVHMVHSATVRKLSMDLLLCEDVAIEARCNEAFTAVRHFEDVMQLVKAPIFNATGGAHVLVQPHTQIVQLSLRYGAALGFKEATAYDALQLFNRVLSRPSAASLHTNLWPLLLCSCLLIVARQAEHPTALPTYDHITLLTGFSTQAIVGFEQKVYMWVQDASAVSPMRVAHLLLERLGVNLLAPAAVDCINADLSALMLKMVLDSTLSAFSPSVQAAAAVVIVRKLRGMVPYWPLAMIAMTGYPDCTSGPLGECLANMESLL